MAGISLQSAEDAGAIANQILAVTAFVNAVNIAAARSCPIVSIQIDSGGQRVDLLAGVTLDVGASATVINGLWSSCQTLIAQYNAALAALEIT